MAKQLWKPGNMIYPLPAVMVSVTDGEGHDNIITVAWTGTVCTNPAMAYISVRPSRYSYDMIRKTGEFVINLTTEKLAFATDFCGVRSGRDVDKFRKLNLTKEKAQFVSAPMIGEAPVSIECRVREVKELGSHDMFLADVLAVHADEAYMDKNNRFCLNDAGLLVYSHGEYLAGGRKVGTFGYSVKKKQQLADKLNVRPSSVSKMVGRLRELGLVQFEKYGLITLTKKGDEIAAYLLWRHDVLLRFFQRLNHTGGQLSLVEQVEHFMDQETVRNLERLLDAFPKDFEK